MYNELTERWFREHIGLLYGHATDEKVALLLIKGQERIQRIVRPSKLVGLWGWLKAANARGYNVYASVNLLRPDARDRKAESFLPEQTAIYLDFDSKLRLSSQMFKELYRLIEQGKLPQPTWGVKSSRGNYQVYWLLEEPVEHTRLQAIMIGLERHFVLDAVHDIARVFRVPGLRNKKPGKDDLVTVPQGYKIAIGEGKLHITRRKLTREEFERMEAEWAAEGITHGAALRAAGRENKDKGIASRRSGTLRACEVDHHLLAMYLDFQRREKYRSRSERDIAFVIKAIVKGYTKQEVMEFLAKQRADKRDPIYYAELTTRKAEEFICRRRRR